MSSDGADFNSADITRERELVIEHLISDLDRPACGDFTVSHYVDSDGELSLEGIPVTEWIVSDTTAADILEGDGR